MIRHDTLGDTRYIRARQLRALLDAGKVAFAANRRLRIYGLLSCTSGKQLKPDNRVFFASATEAETAGYRPCARCMRDAYLQWKQRR